MQLSQSLSTPALLKALDQVPRLPPTSQTVAPRSVSSLSMIKVSTFLDSSKCLGDNGAKSRGSSVTTVKGLLLNGLNQLVLYAVPRLLGPAHSTTNNSFRTVPMSRSLTPP